MDWWNIIVEIARGGFWTVLMVTGILLPIMLVLELMKDSGWLDRVARFIRPVMRIFTLPEDGAYPLLAGVFFGISYGSGVILAYSGQGGLTRRDMTLIATFLAICHGLIEDPLVFKAMGASWWIVVGVRVLLAAITLYFLGQVIKKTAPVDVSAS